jgi:hypothetical protein
MYPVWVRWVDGAPTDPRTRDPRTRDSHTRHHHKKPPAPLSMLRLAPPLPPPPPPRVARTQPPQGIVAMRGDWIPRARHAAFLALDNDDPFPSHLPPRAVAAAAHRSAAFGAPRYRVFSPCDSRFDLVFVRDPRTPPAPSGAALRLDPRLRLLESQPDWLPPLASLVAHLKRSAAGEFLGVRSTAVGFQWFALECSWPYGGAPAEVPSASASLRLAHRAPDEYKPTSAFAESE